MAERLRELGVTVRIEVVPSGIDVARFGAGRRDEALRARLGAAPGRPAPALRRPTGEGEERRAALRGAARMPAIASLKLVVAGDGPLREELERWLRELGRRAADDVSRRRRRATSCPTSTPVPTRSSCRARPRRKASSSPRRWRPARYVIAADAPQNRDVLGGAGRVVPPTPEAFAARPLPIWLPGRDGSRRERREARAAALFDRGPDRPDARRSMRAW